MVVLGIETSCDETAVALVRDDRTVLASLVLSQLEDHRPYGGIVPEIAARAHLDHLDGMIARMMAEAKVDFADLDGVAATAGPGLIGALLVGVTMAKAIALVNDTPFIAVNHLEGHALTARLTDDTAFPYLLLLVSGGHTELVIVDGVGRYRRLGATRDDAVGEAFDKTARLLGLGYPGGPAIEQVAAHGDDRRFALPRPMRGRKGCDFSFSGLKTAMRHAVHELGGREPTAQEVADLSAAFQSAVADVVADRCANALQAFKRDSDAPPHGTTLVVAGGVAANAALRARLAALCAQQDARLVAPPAHLCTDNAAMIAWAGCERRRRGMTSPLDFAARPRWPLEAAN